MKRALHLTLLADFVCRTEPLLPDQLTARSAMLSSVIRLFNHPKDPPPAQNIMPGPFVAIDEAGSKANERISDLDTDSKWPSREPGPPVTPRTARRKIRAALKKNKVPCDMISASDDTTTSMDFQKRGYDMNTKPTDKAMLGEGGFGKVIPIYGPRRERSSLQVEETSGKHEEKVKYACKIIDDHNKYEKRLQEFGNELRGLNAGCGHPNIIQIFDAFIIQRQKAFKFYIVMEYCDGGDLKKHTSRHGPHEESRARRYFVQIGDALNFLHAQNIAHRDLKLHNVMINTEKDPRTGLMRKLCKLIDMGLSSVYYDEDTGPKLCTGVAGTRHAMAPEILQNDIRRKSQPYDPMPADIWALGVILYEMLTRVLPFNPNDAGAMLWQQNNRSFSFKRKLSDRRRKRGELPPLTEDVKHLVRMILDPDPVARWTWREISCHPWISRTRSKASGATSETKGVESVHIAGKA